jgi:hypothetical protein
MRGRSCRNARNPIAPDFVPRRKGPGKISSGHVCTEEQKLAGLGEAGLRHGRKEAAFSDGLESREETPKGGKCGTSRRNAITPSAPFGSMYAEKSPPCWPNEGIRLAVRERPKTQPPGSLFIGAAFGLSAETALQRRALKSRRVRPG